MKNKKILFSVLISLFLVSGICFCLQNGAFNKLGDILNVFAEEGGVNTVEIDFKSGASYVDTAKGLSRNTGYGYAISGKEPGRLVFNTSCKYDGSMNNGEGTSCYTGAGSGIAKADAICQWTAEQAGIAKAGEVFKAALTTSTQSAADHTVSTDGLFVGYEDVSGTQISWGNAGVNELNGKLDERGQTTGNSWAGTWNYWGDTGTITNCSDWASVATPSGVSPSASALGGFGHSSSATNPYGSCEGPGGH